MYDLEYGSRFLSHNAFFIFRNYEKLCDQLMYYGSQFKSYVVANKNILSRIITSYFLVITRIDLAITRNS